MSNPYFDFPISLSRFVPRSLARAEDVNARFDEVSTGFDGVTTALALKANLSGATFSGAVTFSSTTTFNAAATFNSTASGQSPGGVNTSNSNFATTAWVQSVIGATSVGLPVQTTHAGKFLATNGTSASWRYLTMRTVALTSNTTLDTSHSAAFISVTTSPTLTFSAPATLGDDWYAVISNAGTGNVTVQHTSGNVDGLTSYLMYPGELRLFRCNGTTVASSVLAGFRLSFTGSSTFTMPPGYRYLGYDLIGGGAGGQCGGRTSGAGNSTSGGAGGSGGGRYISRLDSPSGGTSVTVNVGTGGTGAAGRTTTGSAVNGNSGTNSSLVWASVTRALVTGGDATTQRGGALADASNVVTSLVGSTGSQGANRGYSAELGGGGGNTGGSGQFSTNGADGGSSVLGGPGGAGGGGANDLASTRGGVGGTRNSYTLGGGGAFGATGGGTGGTAANSGGGGGGGSHVSNAGNGGNGTGYGAGGGGGGAAHGFNSGAGGNGADGYAEVWGIA